jgi:hypothetical protein
MTIMALRRLPTAARGSMAEAVAMAAATIPTLQ